MQFFKHHASAEKSSFLICFSQLRWGFVFQRPQHLMTRAAQTFRVIFWEEPIHQQNCEPHIVSYTQDDGVVVLTPVLPHGLSDVEANRALKELLDTLLRERGVGADFVAWYITPMMLSFSEHLQPRLIVYDKMDELSAFKNAPAEMKERERQLMDQADIVFTGGMSIYEANRNTHKNIHAFPSSIDQSHFGKARVPQEREPEDQAAIARPRIGWFGVIDERMDIDLLAKLASLKPEWQFVMVGPVVKIDPETLPQAENIHWLGGKDYKELPAYLAGWDAGLIPFAINESTRFISPTKTPEFLAAGVPVASTPVQDIVVPYGQRGLVEIASSAEDMAEVLTRAMAMQKAPWITQVDQFLAGKSWDQTWAEMENLMQVGLAKLNNQKEVA